MGDLRIKKEGCKLPALRVATPEMVVTVFLRWLLAGYMAWQGGDTLGSP
jgi:hypothetical protein